MIETKNTTETPEQRVERLLRLPTGAVRSVEVSAHDNGLTYAAVTADGVVIRTCGLNWWDPEPIEVAVKRQRHEESDAWEARAMAEAGDAARALGWKAFSVDGPHFDGSVMRATVSCLPDPTPRPAVESPTA